MCLHLYNTTVIHKFYEADYEGKPNPVTSYLLRVFGGEMGPYYFCLATKLGFISVDTQTLRLAVLSRQQTELCNTHSDSTARTAVIFLKDNETAHTISHV